MRPFLLLLSCLIIFSPNTYAQSSTCDTHSCIMVIDAGSTGSRAHLYTYDLDDTHTAININEIWSKKVKPGFASVESNHVNEYLSTLFAEAPDVHAPVYFYATAGMRLLSDTKQKMQYKELQQWFAQQAKWQLVAGKTITGKEEALYDWLAVNYTLGTLQSNPVGVLDMGGASVQIVFPVNEDTSNNNSAVTELNIHGQSIRLFTTSFLGLGQTQMSNQFLNYAPCFSNEYPLPNGKVGAGDFATCVQKVTALINGVHNVNETVQPILANNPIKSWYAIGGISNLAEQTLFAFPNNQFTSQQLMHQGDSQVCHQGWDKLSSEFPSDEYLYGYCLFSAYFYALLVDGYGFNPEQTINYIPTKENIDWTKGVVLHH